MRYARYLIFHLNCLNSVPFQTYSTLLLNTLTIDNKDYHNDKSRQNEQEIFSKEVGAIQFSVLLTRRFDTQAFDSIRTDTGYGPQVAVSEKE